MKPRLAASPDFIRETRRLIRAAGGRREPVMNRARRAWNGGFGAFLFAAFLVAMPAVLHAPDSHVGNPGDALLLLGVLLCPRGWIRADHAHHLPLAFWPADEDAAVRRLARCLCFSYSNVVFIKLRVVKTNRFCWLFGCFN